MMNSCIIQHDHIFSLRVCSGHHLQKRQKCLRVVLFILFAKNVARRIMQHG